MVLSNAGLWQCFLQHMHQHLMCCSTLLKLVYLPEHEKSVNVKNILLPEQTYLHFLSLFPVKVNKLFYPIIYNVAFYFFVFYAVCAKTHITKVL